MERKAKNQSPNTSTLWLAIGLGSFSVFASFFMAIYFASTSANGDTAKTKAPSLEVSAWSSD